MLFVFWDVAILRCKRYRTPSMYETGQYEREADIFRNRTSPGADMYISTAPAMY